MRKAILIAIMLIAPNAWCGDEDEKEEPKGPSIEEIMEKDAVLERNVKRIVSRMEKEDKELEEAKKKHKEAIAELKDDLVEAYERRMKHYTRKGDIRTATALMETVDKIKENDEVTTKVSVDGRIRIIIWNQHNAGFQNHGTKEINIEIGKWSKTYQTKWDANSDPQTEIKLPSNLSLDKIEKVKINITKWYGVSGGFSEIKIFSGDLDVTNQFSVSVSGELHPKFDKSKITDGVFESTNHGLGYWLLPKNANGWVLFSKNDTTN